MPQNSAKEDFENDEENKIKNELYKITPCESLKNISSNKNGTNHELVPLLKEGKLSCSNLAIN